MSKDIIQKSIECLAKAKLETTYEVARNIVLDYITNLQTIEQQYSAILSENAELENKLNQYENPDDLTLFYMWLDTKAKDKIKQLQEENERLNKNIIIMEKYLELIRDLGYDYDGLNYEHDLKGLIDGMVRFASLGRACNITEEIYVDSKGKSLNILGEELKENKYESKS